MQLALALDVGTTSLGAVAVSADGRVRGSVQRPNPAHRGGLPSGRAEQDPDLILEAGLDALRSLAGQIEGDPAVLGLTGQMHGILLADPADTPLTPLISWQDLRANERRSDGGTDLESLLSGCAPDSLTCLGCRPSPGFGAATLYTLGRRGELPRGSWSAVTIADWIGAALTGQRMRIDPSNAASLGLFDVAGGCWSEALLEAVGITSARLPEIARSGTRLGGLQASIAAGVGLPSGLPVIAAIGDNQAAVIGSLPAGEQALQINIGTGGQINWPIPSFARVDGMDTRPLPVGRLMLTGAGVSGGDAYAWVARTASAWLEAFGETRDSAVIYERLAELAAAAPEDNAGLTCRPAFRGTRRRPHARGELRGVSDDNFTPGHLARAVLEGIAEGLHEFVEAAGEARPEAQRIIATGNAVRRNPLLVRILQSRFGLPVWIPRHQEEAAFGAALLAGSSAGVWADLAEAASAIRLQPASEA